MVLPFKIATFNANSIRARLPILQEWLHRESPDIVCIQETKVQDKDFPALDIEKTGYHVVYKGQKSYNGVALISKHPPGKVRKALYDHDENEEARFISAEIQGISVVNVYLPQGFEVGSDKFAYKLQWFDDLIAYVKTQCSPDQPLILAGDFNVALEPVDVYDPESLRGSVGFHPEEQAALRQLMDWGLVDVFRIHHKEGEHYTFWDYRIPNALKRKMGWRIDYILATRSLAETCHKSWIDTEARALPKPSDHTFLIAEFE